MINLITSSRIVESEFAKKCKEKGVEFRIIERLVELFLYFKELNGSTIIIDCNNAIYKQIVDELLRSSQYMKDAIIFCEDACQCYENNFKSSKFDDVFAVALDRELNRVKYPNISIFEIERAAKVVLERYGFCNKYEGYKYLNEICLGVEIKKDVKFNCKEEIINISKNHNLKSCLSIERNLRYIIDNNSNSEIIKVKGEGGKVSIKAVVMFLVSKIDEILKM